MRLLRGETGLTAANHIAQTYAYSWENHLCEASHLCSRLTELLPHVDFDFNDFLSSLSEICYRPMLYLIYYGADSNTNRIWNVSLFNACIPLQPRRSELTDNGTVYLAIVKSNFDRALESIDRSMGTSNIIANELLTEANAYLHIQGHQLYRLILHIGTILCKGKGIAFGKDILNCDLHTAGYVEIEALQRDLNHILNGE